MIGEGQDMIDYFAGARGVSIEAWIVEVDTGDHVLEFETMLNFVFYQNDMPLTEIYVDDERLVDMVRWGKICAAYFGDDFEFESFRNWLLKLVLRMNSAPDLQPN